jgi:hypothetical protein
MSRANRDRRMLTTTVTTDTLAERISLALRREFGEWGGAVKRLAAMMVPPADPRAVRNWWDGANAPSARQLLQLGQVSIEVRRELLDILAARESRAAHIAEDARRRHDEVTWLADAQLAQCLAAGPLAAPKCLDPLGDRAAATAAAPSSRPVAAVDGVVE